VLHLERGDVGLVSAQLAAALVSRGTHHAHYLVVGEHAPPDTWGQLV
jgi:hypothetical protein